MPWAPSSAAICWVPPGLRFRGATSRRSRSRWLRVSRPGVIAADDLVAVLAVGTSGAGKSLRTDLLASEIAGSASAYQVGGVHRHTPEIIQNLEVAGGAGVTISFTPVLVPMARGILATSTAKLVPGTTEAQVRAAWEQAYADEPFVHVLPGGPVPALGRHDRREHGAHRPRDRRGGRPGRRGQRDRQPRQGHGGRRRPVREPRARLRRDARPPGERSRAVSVTAPAGVRGGRRRRRPQEQRRRRSRARRQPRPAAERGRRLHEQPGEGEPDHLVAAGHRRRRPSARSCSTPAGRTASPAPRASRPRTRPPRRSARRSASPRRDVLVCSTGLIGDQLDRAKVLAGVAAAASALSAPTAVRMPPSPS